MQELTQRTGKNPNYQYVQIGCSQKATAAMLQFARAQVGKPFSSMGMFRSMVWPRATDMSSWYCAELVAACLKTGGLMSQDSNPGAATPHSLYKLYKAQGAIMANPCTLRQQFGAMPTRPFALAVQQPVAARSAQAPLRATTTASSLPLHATPAPRAVGVATPLRLAAAHGVQGAAAARLVRSARGRSDFAQFVQSEHGQKALA